MINAGMVGVDKKDCKSGCSVLTSHKRILAKGF